MSWPRRLRWLLLRFQPNLNARLDRMVAARHALAARTPLARYDDEL